MHDRLILPTFAHLPVITAPLRTSEALLAISQARAAGCYHAACLLVLDIREHEDLLLPDDIDAIVVEWLSLPGVRVDDDLELRPAGVSEHELVFAIAVSWSTSADLTIPPSAPQTPARRRITIVRP